MQNNHWIDVADRRPEQGQRILATIQCRDKAIVTTIKYDDKQPLAEGCRLTAWMPVPEAYVSDIARMYKLVCLYLRKRRCIKLR